MRQDFWYPSCGAGQIHGLRWTPEGEAKAVVQIVHGIAEFAERYDGFARYLNSLGYLVVAEDHMGHGQSMEGGSIQGYFHGGWFAAVEDTYKLLTDTKAEFPELPYILFGHSMGSFMARTILCDHPDSGIAGAVICGTAWQPTAALPALAKIIGLVGRRGGETHPSELLQSMIFGSYNSRVEHPRTAFDWLSRDSSMVDAYVAHPWCGFTASAGLLRDMMTGIHHIQKKENLAKMNRALPVLFIAGGSDPVGNYGKGVEKCAGVFRKLGMEQVSLRIFPLCRHEILNEINRQEVYETISRWLEKTL